MSSFFDEFDYLNIDDLIIQQSSFKKIIEDGVVTESELTEQSSRVKLLLKDIEQTASPVLIEKFRQLLAEMSVLIAARDILENKSSLVYTIKNQPK